MYATLLRRANPARSPSRLLRTFLFDVHTGLECGPVGIRLGAP